MEAAGIEPAQHSSRCCPLDDETPSASVVKLGRVPMAVAPWIISDALWDLVAPLLPSVERRFLKCDGRFYFSSIAMADKAIR
jgi:hypothetical protein